MPGATAGWYADPEGTADLRWWDGEAWTTERRPNQAPPSSPEVESWILPTSAPLPETVAPAPGREPQPPQSENPIGPPVQSDPDEEAKSRLAAAYYRLRRRPRFRPKHISPLLSFAPESYLWYRALQWIEDFRNGPRR